MDLLLDGAKDVGTYEQRSLKQRSLKQRRIAVFETNNKIKQAKQRAFHLFSVPNFHSKNTF